MSQAESTKMLHLQDADRAERNAKKIADAFHKTPLHASTPTVCHIQKEAESMLQNEMKQSQNYISIRVSSNKWLVLHAAGRDVPNGLKPVFERVREVTITESGHMECSCGFPSEFGLPDCHMGHVVTQYASDFQGWTPQDVAVRHRNDYCYLVASKLPSELTDEEKKVRAKLLAFQDLRLPVPNAPAIDDSESSKTFAVGENCTNHVDWTHRQVQEKIKKAQDAQPSALNYTAEEIQEALRVEGVRENAAGLTQSHHLCDEEFSKISFNWDPTQSVPPIAVTSPHSQVAPVLKELGQALENVSDEEEQSASANWKTCSKR